MPVISIPTSFNIDVAFEVPSFGRRMASLFIDMAVELCYIIAASWLVGKLTEQIGPWDEDGRHNLWAIQLLVMAPLFLYHIIMEITTNGQSIGKKIMHLRVVNDNGGKASISQFLIRWLLRVSDLWIVVILILLLTLGSSADWQTFFIFLLGFGFLVTDIVLVASSKKSQRIGDLLAHTIVIRTNKHEDLSNTIFREVREDYVPVFPQVMHISDRDLNIIKNLLDNAHKTHRYDSLKMAADRVKDYLKIETDMEPYQFLDKLLEDYNYLSTNQRA
ncbi:RDD family protein [Niabella beijingensis]|uniref:RDD family protein n=1 Tax=Niabella beijingensis TaxID=2872700 RepID=UPI001CBDCBBB|nr:RDD family protein [Niabella beijingensis]MBZ4188538.1 RDD family protein [Niabella beijingensis]